MNDGNEFAYPSDANENIKEGLTKREYFAAKAMQAYVGGEWVGQKGVPQEMIAQWSVEMADALIYELCK